MTISFSLNSQLSVTKKKADTRKIKRKFIFFLISGKMNVSLTTEVN